MALLDGTIAYRADVLTADEEPQQRNGHAHAPLILADVRGEYEATSTPCVRPFTQQWNDTYDEAMYFLSGTAYKVLSFLFRQTVGYQRASVRVSLTEISEGRARPDGRWDLGTGCSRRQIIEALHELHLGHLITSDADARSRTQIRAYRLTQPEQWTLDALATSTSEKNALVRRRVGASEKNALARTGEKISLVTTQTSEISALVDGQTSAEIAPYRNKEKKERRKKEIPAAHAADDAALDAPVIAADDSSDHLWRDLPVTREAATATTTTSTPSAPSKEHAKRAAREKRPPSSASPPQTDEQPPTTKREARYSGEEQAYVRQGVEALCADMKIKKLPDVLATRGVWHEFYRARDGDPTPIEEVMEWRRLLKSERYWQGKYLPLQHVWRQFIASEGDLEAYRRQVDAEQQRERERTYGRSGAASSSQQRAAANRTGRGAPGGAREVVTDQEVWRQRAAAHRANSGAGSTG